QPAALPLPGHKGKVHVVAFSADGKSALTAGDDGVVRVWDLATGRAGLKAEHKAAVKAAAFAGNGRDVIAGCDDRTVGLAAADGRALWSASFPRAPGAAGRSVTCLALTPDGERVIVGTDAFALGGFDAATGERLFLAAGWGLGAFTGLAVAPDGKTA